MQRTFEYIPNSLIFRCFFEGYLERVEWIRLFITDFQWTNFIEKKIKERLKIYFKDMQNTTMERKTKDQRFRKIFRRIEETDCEFLESKISKF